MAQMGRLPQRFLQNVAIKTALNNDGQPVEIAKIG